MRFGAEWRVKARSAGGKPCAFAEDRDVPDTVLALTGEEQRTLYERIAFLDRCNRAMYERLPGTDLSMFGALAFLYRAAREEEDGAAETSG